MADLNQSLRKRRAELVAEQEQLTATLQKTQHRLGDVTGAISGIDAVLKLEQQQEPTNGASSENPTPPQKLQSVLFSLLADRRPHSTAELAEEAAKQGIDFEEKNPLRAVGFTLLGIKKGGRVQRMDDGRWRLPSNQ